MTSGAPTARVSEGTRWLGPLVIVAFVLIGNAVYLAGVTIADPRATDSGLAVNVREGWLPGRRVIDPSDGFQTQALGRRAATDLIHGRLPDWSPFSGAGLPLLASPQAAALFPGTLLLLLPDGLLIEYLLLECVAGLATYAVARRICIHRGPAVVAGIAFALNCAFAWAQGPIAMPVAFMPLLVLGVEHAGERAIAGRRGGFATIAVSLALACAAGFPEVAYLDGLLVAAWTVWRLWSLPPEHRRRFVAKIGAGLVAGFLLAAPVLGPLLSSLHGADIGGNAGAFSKVILPATTVPTMLGMPYAYGPIFAYSDPSNVLFYFWNTVGGFVSTSLLLLGALALFGRRLRGLRYVLAGWIIFCVVKTFGPRSLVTVLNLLPGLRILAFYRYMPASLALAATLLAALAIDDLIDGAVARRDIYAVSAMTVAAMWLADRIADPIASTATTGALRALHLSFDWALVLVGALTVAALLRSPRARLVALAALVAMDAVVMFAMPELSAPRRTHIDTTSVTWLRQHLGVQRFVTFGPIEPNYGADYGVASASQEALPVPKAWATYMRTALGPDVDPSLTTLSVATQHDIVAHPDFLMDLAVSYVVVPHGLRLGDPLGAMLTIVHQDQAADVYALTGARPYFDVGSSPCRISTQSRQAVHVRCDGPGTLVRREEVFPGWHATIDGRRTPVLVAEGLFQEVHLPAGDSTVAFGYLPPHWWAEVWLAVLGGAWLVLARLVALGPAPGSLWLEQLIRRGGRRGASPTDAPPPPGTPPDPRAGALRPR